MLNEQQIEELRAKYGKIADITHGDHQIVFRKANREDAREYRRQIASVAEKHEATEHLAQKLVVAFDGETDVAKARTVYTGVFLEEFPLFANTAKVNAAVGWLTGMVEDEEVLDLGKGVMCRSAHLASLRAASPSGSTTASGTPN